MAAVRMLLLWTALLALPVPTAATWALANRNTPNRDSGPLRGNFSISTTSAQLTTTTITDVPDASVARVNNIPGAHDDDVVDNVEDGISVNYDDPATIHTITIDDPSRRSSQTSSFLSVPSITTRPPFLNTTLEPPTNLTTYTPSYRPEPPIGTGIEEPSRPAYPYPPTTTEPCTPLEPGEPMTVWSVVYTATVTFNGSYEDYTPPFPPISVPTYCETTATSAPGFFPTTEINLPPGSKTQPTDSGTKRPAKPETTARFPTIDHPAPPLRPWPTDTEGGGSEGGGSGGGGGGGGGGGRPPPGGRPPSGGGGGGGGGGGKDEGNNRGNNGGFVGDPEEIGGTVTFTTTERNPSLLLPTTKPPSFTQSWQHRGGPAGNNGNHLSALGDDTGRFRPLPIFTVIADQSQVVINTETFSNLKPGESSTVTVGSGTFTIEPSAVIGHGQTIRKPAPQPTGAAVTQAPVKDIHVVGGDALTAIGQTIMILHSTTYTYGVGHTEQTVVVDDDTIYLGPSGITVNGKTLGGPAFPTSTTKFEIVGGATITEIHPSLIIIEGKTFTIAADMERTTTVVGGETLTIGPNGVTYSSTLIPLAEAAITTTFQPTATWGSEFPEKTGGSKSTTDNSSPKKDDDKKAGGGGRDGDDGDDDDDDAGAFVRPNLTFLVLAAGIAMGVWELF